MLDEYLAELARRLRGVVGEGLAGVYAGGSYALGAYEPGRSDVDVTAVAERPLDPEPKQAIPRAELLGLLRESVLWHRESAQPTGADAVLNTARALHFAEEGRWLDTRGAGAWAGGEPVVGAALTGAALVRGAVERFLNATVARLDGVAAQA